MVDRPTPVSGDGDPTLATPAVPPGGTPDATVPTPEATALPPDGLLPPPGSAPPLYSPLPPRRRQRPGPGLVAGLIGLVLVVGVGAALALQDDDEGGGSDGEAVSSALAPEVTGSTATTSDTEGTSVTSTTASSTTASPTTAAPTSAPPATDTTVAPPVTTEAVPPPTPLDPAPTPPPPPGAPVPAPPPPAPVPAPVPGRQVDVFALAKDECFDDPTGSQVTTVSVVPCAQAHDEEVYEVGVLPDPQGAVYPGDPDVEARTDQACLDAFSPFVGLPAQQSMLRVFVLRPTAESWDGGDRGYICAVYDPAGPTTGSARAANR